MVKYTSMLILFGTLVNSICSQTTLSELVKLTKPAVFSIATYDKYGFELSNATGFFIEPEGIGISNYHVFNGASQADIITTNGEKYSFKEILSLNENSDLIKFSINNTNSDEFPFFNLSQQKPLSGDDVFIIGNPQGLDFSVSEGIISSIRQHKEIGEVLQITAPISPGSSGSPVIDMSGKVVGIVSFSLIEGQNLNFAIGVSNLGNLKPVTTNNFPFNESKSKLTTNQFKRYEWLTSSETIVNNETFKLKERMSNGDIVYTGFLANIEINLTYILGYDELNSIVISPVVESVFDLRTLSDVYHEFMTFHYKLVNLFGNDLYECVSTENVDCIFHGSKDDFFITGNPVDDYIRITAERTKIARYSTFKIVHYWKVNGGDYTLTLAGDISISGKHDYRWWFRVGYTIF